MDEIKLGLADAALELAFGKEWIELERGRREVLHDFIESNLTAQEYLDNIWAGNLQSYADTLLVKRRF